MNLTLLLLPLGLARAAAAPSLQDIHAELGRGAVQTATQRSEERLAATPGDRETLELLAAVYNETAEEQGARRVAALLKALPPGPPPPADEPEPGGVQEPGPAFVRATTLRVRENPSTAAPVRDVVFLNDRVEVVAVQGEGAPEWVEVTSIGQQRPFKGFVPARLLSKTALDAAALLAQAASTTGVNQRARLLERAATLAPTSVPTLEAAVPALLAARHHAAAVAVAVKLAQLRDLPVNGDRFFHARSAVRALYAWVNAGEPGGERAVRHLLAPDLYASMVRPSCYGEFAPWLDAQDTAGVFRVMNAGGNDTVVEVKVGRFLEDKKPQQVLTVVVRRTNGVMLVDDVNYMRKGADRTLRRYVAGWRRPDKNGDCGPL